MREPIKLLKAALSLFKSHAGLFVGIYLVPALLAVAVAKLLDLSAIREDDTSFSLVVFMALTALLAVVNLLMSAAMIKAISDPVNSSIKGSYSYAYKHFVPFAIVAIMVGLINVVGFLLFIIPGIIFTVWFVFSYYTVLLEGKKGVEALKASREYVRGHWWAVAGRLGFVFLAMAVVAATTTILIEMLAVSTTDMVGVIGNLLVDVFVLPMSMIYVYFMYKDISTKDNGMVEMESGSKTDVSHEPYKAM